MAAPRDAVQKWLAFGAMAAVATGVSIASSCFKDHLNSKLPEPEPRGPHTAMISSPPPAAPAHVKETDPDEGATAALDPRIVPPGTAKSSLGAMPTWAREAKPRYAPVHSHAIDLFTAGSEPSGDLARAVVICHGGRVRHSGDLHMRATFGVMPEVAADGADKATTIYLTAPLVDVKDGLPIEVTLWERWPNDITKVATMGSQAGQHLRTSDGFGSIECVTLAGDALQDRIADDLGRADSAVTRLSRLKIDTRRVWGSEETTERPRVERRISNVAALTGWDDPRVKTRVSSYDAAMKRLDADRRQAFGEAQRTARHDATIDGLFVVFERLVCSRDACDIALRLQNDDRPARAWAFPDVKVTFLTEGKERPQASDEAEMDPTVLAPKEWKQVLIHGPKGLNARGVAQMCLSSAKDMTCGMIALR